MSNDMKLKILNIITKLLYITFIYLHLTIII